MAGAWWQSVFRFDAAKIAPEIAIRNTIGIAISLSAGVATGHASAGVVGVLGALNVCYSDGRDPYAARARRMVLASVLVGLTVSIGALAGYSDFTAILAAMAWAFVAGMFVVLGGRAGDLGTVTLVTLIVFAARSLTVRESLQSGLIASAAGLLQTALSVAVWPIAPWEPERRIIRGLYAELAKIAVTPAIPAGAPPAAAVITGAREALSSLSQDRSVEAERLAFLLSQAERIRLSLLTVRRLRHRIEREPAGKGPSEILDRILVAASEMLHSIGSGNRTPALDPFTRALRVFREQTWPETTPLLAALIRDAGVQVEALGGQLRAVGLSSQQQRLIETQDRFARLKQLYANLSLRSTAFRHALRLAVCVGAGDTLGRLILSHHDLQRAYWLPMTIAIVLKPDFTTTFVRGVLRIAGTLAGLLIATAMFHFLPTGAVTDIALLTLFAFLLRWIGPANYGLFTISISSIIVLLAAVTGVDPQPVIVARAINTAMGGMLAMAAWLIWPTWERTQTGAVLAGMLEAYRDYFHAVMRAYGGAPDTDLDRERLRGRLARSNAEASVARVNSEPGVSPEQAALLAAVLISSHSFARAAMALESGVDETKASPPRPATLAFASKVESTLEALASSLRNRASLPPDLPDLRAAWNEIEQTGAPPAERYALANMETDRIATSLNTLREQVAKLDVLD